MSTLSGGRLNTQVTDLAASVSILTRDFLNDIQADDLLAGSRWLTSAQPDVPSALNDYAVSIRGFRPGFSFRNYFISYANTDSYALDRIESSRGPNALVFGDTKVGGALNVSTKQARTYPITQLSYRYSSFGGYGRTALDFNRALSDKVQARVAALWQDDDDWMDNTGTRRKGVFGTVTFTPFEKTTIRVEGEVFDQFRRIFGTRLTDNISGWDTSTTYTGPISAGNAAAGIARASATAPRRSMYGIRPPGDLGVVNWTGWAQTTGSGMQLDTIAPANTNARMPLLPSRDYTIRFNNAGSDQDYQNLTLTLQQQVGDNLFLELAASDAFNRREVDQLPTEAFYVDVNRNLPNGQPNPYFGERFVYVDAFQKVIQSNRVSEVRATAAYVFATDAMEHRALLGAAFRRDGYRDNGGYWMMNVPGAVFGNVFQNNNRVRLRLYESDRGTDVKPPPGAVYGRWNFFPGEDKDLVSYQAAVSSGWFKDRRLRTLLGYRSDELSTFGVTATADPVTREFISYNTRLNQRDFPAVDTLSAGLLYKVTSNFSPYANFAQGYDTSNAGLMLNPETDAVDIPLPAKESEGKEIGVRFSLFDNKVSGSVAYYWNEQTNDNNTGVGYPRAEINRLWVDSGLSEKQIPVNPIEVINYKGQGFEFEMVANLTREWRLIANFSLPETEVQNGWANTNAYIAKYRSIWEAARDAQTNTTVRNRMTTDLNTVAARQVSVSNGRSLPGTFDYTANLFSTYEFRDGPMKGFRIGGGANFRGERVVESRARVATDPDSLIYNTQPGYATYSALLGYRTKIGGVRMDLQLNVDNLLNEQHQLYTSYAAFTPPGATAPEFIGNAFFHTPPRQFVLSAKFDF
jgi:iron complex outermembrane recepter protein